MDDKIELMVQPVGYDDKNFDKFDYYHAIGSWEMAKQIHEETKEQLRAATEQLGIAMEALGKIIFTYTKTDDYCCATAVDIGKQALDKIEEAKC